MLELVNDFTTKKIISEIQIGKVVNLKLVTALAFSLSWSKLVGNSLAQFTIGKTVAAMNPAPVTFATLLFPVAKVTVKT